VRLDDRFQVEALGGLRAIEGFARRNVCDDAVMDSQDRVRGWYRRADGLVVLERSQAVGDDALGDQRAGRVVDEDASLVRPVPGADVREGGANRVRAGDAALDDRAGLIADQSL
jgi:hypothetical protein